MGSFSVTPGQTFFPSLAVADGAQATLNFGVTPFVHTVPAGYNGT